MSDREINAYAHLLALKVTDIDIEGIFTPWERMAAYCDKIEKLREIETDGSVDSESAPLEGLPSAEYRDERIES